MLSPIPDRPRRLLARPGALAATPDGPRLLTRAEIEALFNRIVALTRGGGDTDVTIRSAWATTLRWNRNRPTHAGTATRQRVIITRTVHGWSKTTEVSQLDDATLTTAVRDLEQQLATVEPAPAGLPPLGPQTYLTPPIWSEATAALTMHDLSEIVRQSVTPVAAAQLMGAGHARVGAASWAIFSTHGLAAYAAATGALYSASVRSPDGRASGVAQRTHMDWAKLDVPALAASALQRCRDMANPRALEPGRYTAILMPEAVSHLMGYVVQAMGREDAEEGGTIFSAEKKGTSKLGQRVLDPRLTITSDPMDPDCGYMPFDEEGNPYQPVTWIENGVLKHLPYGRGYAHGKLQSEVALPNPMAYRVSGGETSLEEMIATTERGVLVANLGGRLDGWPLDVDKAHLTVVGTTKNGLWLIEHGKIVHPLTNFWFRAVLMEVFNQVLQLGPAVRVYGDCWYWGGSYIDDLPAEALNEGHTPVVVPSMKVTDFHFTRLTDVI